MDLYITVRNRCAHLNPQPQALVCGYGAARLYVSFDEEWDAYPKKYAHIFYVRRGTPVSVNVPISGKYVTLPAVHDTDCAEICFFAGDLRTALPVRVPCLPAVSEIAAEEDEPHTDAVRLILAKLAGEDAEPPFRGLYLVTDDGDYLVTDTLDFIMAKE